MIQFKILNKIEIHTGHRIRIGLKKALDFLTTFLHFCPTLFHRKKPYEGGGTNYIEMAQFESNSNEIKPNPYVYDSHGFTTNDTNLIIAYLNKVIFCK